MMAIVNPLILLSGTWLPAQYLQDNLGQVIQINPVYQALSALSEIAVKGGGLSDVSKGLAILIAYIIALGTLAVYCYEKRVTT